MAFAGIAATADGDNTVVAGVAGKRIYVKCLTLNTTAAGLVTFKTGSTEHFIQRPNLAVFLPCPCEGYLFAGAPGEAFIASNGVGVDSYGFVLYDQS
jgi:hypothetical protein